MNILSLGTLLLSTSAILSGAVTTGNIVLTSNPSLDADYALTVFQDSAATNPTSILFNFRDAKLIFVNSNIDEGSDWYLGEVGATFSTSEISSGEFTVFVKSDFSGFISNSIDVSVGSFYLGVNTGTGFSASGPNREIFGWVELNSNGSSLSLSSSGVGYSVPGIIIGTTTVVPEPASFGLLFSAISMLFVLSMRREIRQRTETKP